jgi:phosphosulfolactate synthase (CoM biosynthesis protein A)
MAKSHKFEHWVHKYTVVGFETVEVPAGTFKAIKVEEKVTGMPSWNRRRPWFKAPK